MWCKNLLKVYQWFSRNILRDYCIMNCSSQEVEKIEINKSRIIKKSPRILITGACMILKYQLKYLFQNYNKFFFAFCYGFT